MVGELGDEGGCAPVRRRDLELVQTIRQPLKDDVVACVVHGVEDGSPRRRSVNVYLIDDPDLAAAHLHDDIAW